MRFFLLQSYCDLGGIPLLPMHGEGQYFRGDTGEAEGNSDRAMYGE